MECLFIHKLSPKIPNATTPSFSISKKICTYKPTNQHKYIHTYKRNVQQTIEFKRTSRLRFTLSWQQPRHEPDGRQSCWDPLSSHQEPAQRLRICGCTALASTTHIRFHFPTLARPTWDFPFSCLSTFGVWFFTFPARVREPCTLPPPRRRSTKCRVDSF